MHNQEGSSAVMPLAIWWGRSGRRLDRGRYNHDFATTGAGDASLCGADQAALRGGATRIPQAEDRGVRQRIRRRGPQMANALQRRDTGSQCRQSDRILQIAVIRRMVAF